jgi:multiple sugar transport system substrate-binding protein
MNFRKICLILLMVVSCVMVSCSNKGSNENEKHGDSMEDSTVIDTSGEKNSRVLTVSSFTDNVKLERLAEAFHKLHPDVVVQIDIFSKSTTEVISEEVTIGSTEDNGDGTETTHMIGTIRGVRRSNPDIDLQPDKYVLKINTDLMSGQGCDILDLSDLPSVSYADSNYLVDLYELFEQDSEISINDYYTNVFKAYEYKDKLYQLPLGFSYNFCGINNAYMPENFKYNENYWNYNMMFELYNQTNGLDSSLFRGYTPGQPIRNDFNTYFNVKDKTCDINNQFINILTRAFECYNADEEIVGTNAKVDMTNYLFLMLDYPFGISNYKDYYQEEFSYLHPLLNSEGKITLSPTSPGRLAINNNSKEKELAWEFIKFCLSDWAQQDAIAKPRLEEDPIGIRGFLNFPIKKSAFEAVFANDPVMDEELYQELKEWNESDFEANLADAVITQMFSDELRSYRQGSQTAEQTAENLQNKISTYLNE